MSNPIPTSSSDLQAARYGTQRDTLAARHGSVESLSANINGTGQKVYEQQLGNVLFLDGHVGLVDNDYYHLQAYGDLLAP